jgi:hypothetical protein
MENFNENDWTTVHRKNKKKHNKQPSENKQPVVVSQKTEETQSMILNYVQETIEFDRGSDPLENGYRLMTKKDYNLTSQEKKILQKARYTLFCCLCCDNTNEISKIIGRRVYHCGTCYCCIGDDPFGDICTVYVNDVTGTMYMSATKEDMEELSEFNRNRKYNKEYEYNYPFTPFHI